jgi:hypothetical protein
VSIITCSYLAVLSDELGKYFGVCLGWAIYKICIMISVMDADGSEVFSNRSAGSLRS